MPTTIMFVHGTGVRSEGYEKAYAVIAPNIQKLGFQAAKCIWGDDYGSRFGGVALPSYLPEQEQKNIAMWEMLLQDPFAELQLLETAPDAEGLSNHGDVLWDKLLLHTPGESAYVQMRKLNLDPFWLFAFERLTKDSKNRWEILVKRAAQPDGQFELALSRCLAANMIRAAEEQWMIPPDGEDRDELVQALVDDLGGTARGFMGNVLKIAMGLFTPAATSVLRWTRDAWSAGASPVIGDILMYQARGQAIRDCIRDTIEAQKGPTVVLGHSLGGIATVDLLLTADLPQVKALITVGSQSSYLYEINALYGLEKGKTWPDRFPGKWLNIYDPNDFLSYPAEGILPGRVKDFCNKSQQPFPESHSAYWRSREVWKQIENFLAQEGTVTA